MRVLDTSALDYAAKNSITLSGQFFVSPDVLDEFEVGHDRRPPKNVVNIFDVDGFDRATYLRNYKEMLNTYGGRSFYNMTGFGDISILALLATLKAVSAAMLPGLAEDVDVVSSDGGLIKKLRLVFSDQTNSFDRIVHIYNPREYF